MNSSQVQKSLNIIDSELAEILDNATSTHVLQQARAQVRTTNEQYQKYAKQTHQRNPIMETGWGFSIRQPALRFNPTMISGHKFRIDLTCELRWRGQEPAKRNITIRLWALERNIFFREEWDAVHLGSHSINERVMMRFHFDLADQNQSAPLHHLQIGGVAAENENCWLPRIEKPRFPHMPMDLVLVCELIGATFYEQSYRKIRKSSQWTGEIRKSQESLLRNYFEGCLKTIDSQQSVLTDYLWSLP